MADSHPCLTPDELECSIEVTGVPSEADDDDLYGYFENRRFGGGAVNKLSRLQNGAVIVTFQSADVVSEIVQRPKHRLSGCEMAVQKYCPQPTEPESSSGGCNVVVSGLVAEIDVDDLYGPLESRRLNGGPVESITRIDDESVVVTFASESVASHWASVGELKIAGRKLMVSWPKASRSSPPREEESADPHTVYVENVSEQMRDLLELKLESTRLGGGEFSESTQLLSNRTLVAKFADKSVAANLIKQGFIDVESNRFKITKACPTQPRESSSASQSTTIEVSGINKNTSEEFLRMYFESERRSGGGDIASMQFNQDEGTAAITFKSPLAVSRVMAKEVHLVSDTKLNVIQLESLTPDLCDQECAVVVTGIKPSIHSSDLVELYFQSNKKSGGGDIDNIHYSEKGDSAVITFSSHQVAEQVVNWSHGHTLSGVSLTVDWLRAAPPPPIVTRDVDNEKLLFQRLPDETNSASVRGDFEQYVAKGAGCPVCRVTFADQPDVAVVEFEGCPDYKSMRRLVSSKPFRGQMISVQRVQATHCIVVLEVGSLPKDLIELHFEDARRSSGGEVRSITMNSKENCAVVEFKDRRVIKGVLERKHVINNQNVQVKLYYPYLSSLTRTGVKKLSVTIPDDASVSIDKPKVQFVLKFDTFRQKVETELSNNFCSIVWPHSLDDCSAVLHCTLTPETVESRKQVAEWEDKCITILTAHLDSIVSGDENLNGEIWSKYRGQIAEQAARELSDMWISYDDANHHLFYVGPQEIVRCFQSLSVKVTSTLMEELAKAKSKKFELISNLSPPQLQIVKQSRFWEGLNNDLEVKIEPRGISFQGTEKQISEAKLKLYQDIVINIQKRAVTCAPFKLKLIQKPEAEQYFKTLLEGMKFNVAWAVEDDSLVMFGSGDKMMNEAFSVIDKAIVQNTVPVDLASLPALSLPEWKTLEQALIKKSKFLSIGLIEKTVLACCGLDDDVSVAVNEISQFLQMNTIVEQFVAMSEGKVAYLQRYMANELKRIRESASSPTFKLEPIEDGQKSGYSIRGTRNDIKDTGDQLFRMSRDILEVEHDSDIPGTHKYFTSKNGRDSIKMIETKEKVIVLVTTEESPGSQAVGHPGGTQGPSSGPVGKSEVSFNNGQGLLQVVKGCITQCTVDAIIVPIGDELKHVTGAAKALADAGGSEILAGCRNYVKTAGGNPLPGQALKMAYGSLNNCKNVIYAVVDSWKGGQNFELDMLFEAVYSALKVADGSLNASAVAIAGISEGYPADQVSRTMLTAVIDYYKGNSPAPGSLSRIIFVDPSDQFVNYFHETLSSNFGKDQVRVLDGLPLDGSMAATASGPDTAATPAAVTVSSRYSKTSTANVISTPEGLNVSLVKGSIVVQNADILVNTVSPAVDLTQGAVSSTILQAAGAQMQTECKNSAGQNATAGDVIPTASYNMANCKRVYHAICEKDEVILRKVVNKCLSLAHQEKMTSIAFPALGTGNLKVPAADASRIMYDEVDKFSNACQTTTVKNIGFVVYDDLTFRAFEQHVGNLVSPSALANAAATSRPGGGGGRRLKTGGSDASLANLQAAPDATDKSKKTKNKKKNRIGTSIDGKPVDFMAKSVKIGPISLQVRQGDITDERVDAIVNSTNDKLSLAGGAVTKAIVDKGGQTIVDECRRQGGTVNGIAVTGSGDLPCKLIIHLAAPAGFDKKPPSLKDWEEGVMKCLKEADKLKLKSIAFPLLGTGKWTTTPSDMAGCILNTVIDFSMHSKPKYLTKVRVTIFMPNMVDDFVHGIVKKIDEKKSRGLLKSGWSWLTGAGSSGDIQLVDCDIDDDDDDADDGDVVPTARKLLFLIYGTSQKNIDDAVKAINDLGKSSIADQVLDKPEHQAQIAKLNDVQVAQIKGIERQHNIKVTIENGVRIKRIRVQGDNGEVTAAIVRILDILHAADIAAHKKVEADLMAQQAHWEYQLDDLTYEAYPADINLIIEKAFQAKQQNAEWEEDDDSKFMVDFAQNIEFQVNSSRRPVVVKRICDVPIPTPSNWEPIPMGAPYARVSIPMASKEYEEVESNARATARATINEIIKIERIQNHRLYQQYANRRMFMEAANGTNVKNERLLWHGTNEQSVDQINTNGFNRSHQDGNVFLVDWHVAAQDSNSPPDSKKQKLIYQIERIQNPVLYQQYAIRKMHMEAAHGKGVQVERVLWHGTALPTVDQIITNGFNRSYCGKNAVAYGKGSYFATVWYYSANQTYSPPDGQNKKYIFQARVLTGSSVAVQGGGDSQNILEGPLKPGGKARYDSTCDNTQQPVLFVVFEDTQAYPEYLITFIGTDKGK